MDRTPPAFFRQGPSANARLGLFALLAVALLVVDSRIGLLVALRQGVATVLYPVQRTLMVPRDTLRALSDYVGDVSRLRTENAELRRLEAENARSLLQAEALATENAQLRRLLGTREALPVRSVVAEVLVDAPDAFARRVVLDRGTQHGLQAGQPVVDGAGVVGQITRAHPLTSEMTLVTDANLSVPVQVTRSGVRAVLAGSKSSPGQLELRWLPPNADVRENDLLVTSGLDGLYPAGLPVGRVRKVDRGNAAFARVDVVPTGQPERSRVLLALAIDREAPPPPPPPPPAVRAPATRKP